MTRIVLQEITLNLTYFFVLFKYVSMFHECISFDTIVQIHKPVLCLPVTFLLNNFVMDFDVDVTLFKVRNSNGQYVISRC